MDFEFDPSKSATNKDKHGIDFKEAQGLWDDLFRLELPARTTDEPRFAIIARWNSKLWTGIFTTRNEKIRIISVRRAREEEVRLYESAGL